MKPMLFSTEMVQATLDGRKTQTRRVVKPQPDYIESTGRWVWAIPKSKIRTNCCESVCTASREWWEYLMPEQMPYHPGDILYVRETWRAVDYQHIDGEWSASIQFKDMTIGERVRWQDGADTIYERMGWRPSIHMPKEAARLFLRVTAVRVERLQDISLADIEREGLYCAPPYTKEHPAYAGGMRLHWLKLWDSTIKKSDIDKYGWEANPWVLVCEFERVDKPND